MNVLVRGLLLVWSVGAIALLTLLVLALVSG